MKNRVLFVGFSVIAAVAFCDSAMAYEAGAVTDGGVISGKIIYTGNVPIKKIIPTKDAEVCGAPREEPLITVGADQAVQNAVVYLVEVAKGKAWAPPGKLPELNNIKCAFEPVIQVMPAGMIDVVNKDPVLHNSHGYYGKRTAFNLAQPIVDQRIPTELKRAGEVRVDCDAHGWMEGWIYVVGNPYFAITGADGKFSITDVPAGSYKLVAVQPYAGPMELDVTVTAGQAAEMTIELKK